jgi:hypothetical protein
MACSISADRYLLEDQLVFLALFFISGWSGPRTSAYVLKVAIGHHLLSSREVTGAARLQPAPAAMSSLSRTWRTSRRRFPSLLSGLAGDAEPGADLGLGVAAAARALVRGVYDYYSNL